MKPSITLDCSWASRLLRLVAMLALVGGLLATSTVAHAIPYLEICAKLECLPKCLGNSYSCLVNPGTVITTHVNQSVEFVSNRTSFDTVGWIFTGGSPPSASGPGDMIHVVTWDTPGTYNVRATDTPADIIVSVVVLPGTTSPWPVARYDFDTSYLIGFDSSGNNNHGTVGAATVETGVQVPPGPVHGSSLRFYPTNAVNEFFAPHQNYLNIVDYDTPMTGMAWIRPRGNHTIDNIPSDCTQGTIFSKGGNYWFQIKQDNSAVEFQNEGSGAELVSVPVPGGIPADGNTWTHVAFVRMPNLDCTGDTIKVFVNGVFRGQGDLFMFPSANTAPLSVGNYGFTGPEGCEFNGDIDEIRIFDKCLSDGEISAQFQLVQALSSIPAPALSLRGLIAMMLLLFGTWVILVVRRRAQRGVNEPAK